MTVHWIRATTLTVLGAVAVTGAAGLAVSSTASAHTDIVASQPATDAALDASPSSVSLTFSEDIGAEFATVALRGTDGRDQPTATPTVSGTRVTAGVVGTLPGGAYVVNYRVVSADGHPVAGQIPFTVADAQAATAAATPVAAASTTATPVEGTDSEGSDVPWPSIIGFAALGALVGTGIVILQRRRQQKP